MPGMTPAADVVLPPPSVLDAFRLTGRPEPLAGGQGQSVRVGDAVLKPAGGVAETEWAARLMERVAGGGEFRVPPPVRAYDGRWVVDGWAASGFVPGTPGPAGRWADLLAAGRAFHHALRDAPRPPLLDTRRHPWAVADRVAWAELPPEAAPAAVRPLVRRLLSLAEPVTAPSQLVHGDLTGNVLFAPGLPPAVIDFSPYWRPVGYAAAIVAADGLLHHGAAPELTDLATPDPEGAQLLLRALLFRLSTLPPMGDQRTDEPARYERVARLVAQRLSGGG